MIQERVIYQRFCRMVKDQRIRADSLHELEWGTMAVKNPKPGSWNMGIEIDNAESQLDMGRK